jgi:hypothetical protein
MQKQQNPQQQLQQQYSIPQNLVASYSNTPNFDELESLQRTTNERLLREQEEAQRRYLEQQRIKNAQQQNNMQKNLQPNNVSYKNGKSTSTQYVITRQHQPMVHQPHQNMQPVSNPKQKSLNQIRKEYEEQQLRQTYKRRVCPGDIDIVDKVDTMLGTKSQPKPALTEKQKEKMMMERFYSKTKNLY